MGDSAPTSQELPRFGLHDGVDERLYHSDPLSISSSSAKTLLYDGPAEYQRQKANPEHRDSFDFGSVVHALVLGVGDYEVLDFPDWRKKEAREARDEVRARGVAPIIPRDMEKAELMRDAVLEHPTALGLLAMGRPEVSLWATDPATGVSMRGRIDWLRGGTNIDLKTTSGLPWAEVFMGAVLRFGYGFQAAWYMRLLRLNGIEPSLPKWIVVSKRPPYQVEVLQPAQDLVEHSDSQVDQALALYAQCLGADEWPPLQDHNELDYIAHARTVEAVSPEEVVPY